MKFLLRFSIPILISLWSNSHLMAQQASIKGTVQAKESQKSIEFASVSVLKSTDSTLVTGALTDDKGAYLVDALPTGRYILKAVSIGYQTTFATFEINMPKQQLTLPPLSMAISEQLLSELVITGERTTMSQQLDKQTYRANQFEAAKGGTATDVLKNLPSISVNSAGEISMRGSTGFLVLINGKPVLTDPQTILSQLPANTIENIELITAPSAKYDADGKSGIINITTKKGTNEGWDLQTNALAGLPAVYDYDNLEKPIRAGADATLTYNKNKWALSVSGNYNRNDTNGERDGDVFTKDFTHQTLTHFPSFGERSFDRYNYGVRSGVTYTASPKHTFNAGYFWSKKYQQRRADIVYNNSLEDLTTGEILDQLTYFNSNVQTKEGKFTLASLEHVYSLPKEASLTSSFIYENVQLTGNTLNDNLDYPGKSIAFQKITNPYSNPINGYRAKIDYSTPLGQGKLEAGYQYRHDQQEGRFDYTVIPDTQQPDIAKFRGTAKSKNTINAIYAQYGAQRTKLQYNAGLRYEHADREVVLSADPKPHELHLNNLFPSVNLQYAFTQALHLKAGYSKRVQRNSSYELNPIPEREHSETLEQGDPDLLPQFVDLTELGVHYNYAKGSFFSTIYHQHIKNPIQRVNSVYADTILNRVFTNADKARLYGLELGSTYKPTSRITTYLGANVYNYKISGALNILGEQSVVENANWVYSINLNSSFNLGKQWVFQANLNYLSDRPTAQGEDSRFFNPNTTLRKTFKQGRMSVGVQWQNMSMGLLNSNQQRISTWGKDFYTTTNYVYETDVFLLNFSYNLHKRSSKVKLPTSELGEKEF